jgi:hypothetical protein
MDSGTHFIPVNIIHQHVHGERVKQISIADLCFEAAGCGPPGLREDTQLSHSSPLVIQSLSGVPEALSR